MVHWEKEFLTHKNAVFPKDIQNNLGKYMLQCSLYNINQLLDIKPEGGSYIRSSCEPYDDEARLDEKRLKNWREHFHLGEIRQIHVSGHASGADLKRVIQTIKPKEIIPVHTHHAETIRGFNRKE